MSNLGPNFYPKLVQISSELGMNPEDLVAIMVSESGLNPGAVEQKYKGSGLVGFMPKVLENLGYDGGWKEFSKLQGEQQLDYVKKLIQSNMKLNGGPFTSAAQYYVANFWPVALKLPGIRKGDPNTAFIEKNPQTIIDPKTGKKYSKKYYDLGFRISPEQERVAYETNTLFHGHMPNAITYADMITRINKVKQMPQYKEALKNIQNTTSYVSNIQHQRAPQTNKPNSSFIDKFLATINDLLDSFTKMASYKKHNNYLIIVSSDNDYSSAIEYSRILCLAMKEDLNIESDICSKNDCVEIQCNMDGNQDRCKEVIAELSNAIADGFRLATKKIGSINITTSVLSNIISDYETIDIKMAEYNYDAFHNKFKKIG